MGAGKVALASPSKRKKKGVQHAILRPKSVAEAKLSSAARSEKKRQLAAAVAYVTQLAHEGKENGALDAAINSRALAAS